MLSELTKAWVMFFRAGVNGAGYFVVAPRTIFCHLRPEIDLVVSGVMVLFCRAIVPAVSILKWNPVRIVG